MKLTKLERTCVACPSQWEGETGDGREVYIRYRYGQLRVNIGNPALVAPVWENETLVDKQIGDDLDGSMETKEMLEYTGFEYDGNPEELDENERVLENMGELDVPVWAKKLLENEDDK